jgi:hypothetical protein
MIKRNLASWGRLYLSEASPTASSQATPGVIRFLGLCCVGGDIILIL